jgi:hypothetical protein
MSQSKFRRLLCIIHQERFCYFCEEVDRSAIVNLVEKVENLMSNVSEKCIELFIEPFLKLLAFSFELMIIINHFLAQLDTILSIADHGFSMLVMIKN